ncbi:MAG: right-handed parallel beta-helix repeat-containing protein [Armatimonadetes bacterium]|nr:right-handed parallel beta-helix repeat-containing protein [Armatimonadota bacterium]
MIASWLAAVALLACAVAHGAAPVTLRVASFGAKGDGASDDGPAIRAALAKAAALSLAPGACGVTVAFERGRRYRIGAWEERWEALPIIDGHRVCVEGNGAELTVDPKNMAFGVLRSPQTTIRNLTIDYSPLPFTQGVVLEVDRTAGTFLLQLEEGYPVPDGAKWIGDSHYDHGCFVEPAPSPLFTHYWVYMSEAGAVPGRPGVFRIVPSDAAWCRDVVRTHVQPGQRFWFILPHHTREEWARRFVTEDGRCVSSPTASIQLRQSPGCRIEDIRHYSSPRIAIRFDGCDDLVVRGVRIVRRPGATRLAACNSDGIHGRTRRGPIIEDCTIEALGDDSVSVGDLGHTVEEQTAPDALKLAYTEIAWYPSLLEVGDTLIFFDQASGVSLGERRIVRCERSGHQSLVRLDAPIAGVRSRASAQADEARNGPGPTLVLRKPTAPAIIRNCRFRSQLKEAILAYNGAFRIEGNRMEHTAYGIDVQGALGDTLIRGNTIDAPWPFAIGVLGPQVFLAGNTWSARRLAAPFPASITLEANTIRMAPRGVLPLTQGVKVDAYADVVLRGNRITVDVGAARSMQAVLIDRCGRLTLDGNTLDDRRPAVDGGAITLSNMVGAGRTIAGNRLNLRPGVVGIHATP